MPKYINAEVLKLLLSDKLKQSFTAGELEGALGAIGEDKLTEVIGSFVDQLGPKSQAELDVNQFAKSVGRSLISVTKEGNNYSFNEVKKAAAIANFTQLDKSKYDKDTVDIANDILAVLKENKKLLNYHDKFIPGQYATVFATQSVPKILSDDENKTKVAHLIAGVTAKLAGKKSPLVSDPGNLKKALLSAHDGVIDALKVNHVLLNRGAEELMMVGKAIGKEVRAADGNDMRRLVAKSLQDRALER